MAIILTNRSWTTTTLGSLRSPNTALWWVIGGTSVFLALVLITPFTQRMFHFKPLHTVDLVMSVLAGTVCVAWFDGLKIYRRWARRHREAT
jgi:Ca2+-transporting ATPase